MTSDVLPSGVDSARFDLGSSSSSSGLDLEAMEEAADFLQENVERNRVSLLRAKDLRYENAPFLHFVYVRYYLKKIIADWPPCSVSHTW